MFEYGRQEIHDFMDKLEESKQQHEHTWMYVKELEKQLTALRKKN